MVSALQAHAAEHQPPPEPVIVHGETADIMGLLGALPAGVPHPASAHQTSRGTAGDPTAGTARSLGPHMSPPVPPVPPDKTSSRTLPEGRSPDGLIHDAKKDARMPRTAGPGTRAVGTHSGGGGRLPEAGLALSKRETKQPACASTVPKGPAHVGGLPVRCEGLVNDLPGSGDKSSVLVIGLPRAGGTTTEGETPTPRMA